MSRRRWIYTRGGAPIPEPVEVSRDWYEPRDIQRRSEEEIYGHLQATDGSDLSTRRKHREYLEHHGLVMHSDYKTAFEKAAKEKARRFRGEDTPQEDRERKADIANALSQLERQHGRR